MDRIFRDRMSELYWLAYLLTGDRERSVQAYTGALNSEAPAPALQKFMYSWARRLVIVAALGTIRPQLRAGMLRTRAATPDELAGLAGLASVDHARLTKQELEEVLLAMDAFSRSAVILTILEGLPVKEAAELLGADADAVKTAQARGVAEMTWRMADVLGSASHGSFRVGPEGLAAFG
jgi:DNA-directed RNA polymerase specialized sigma24 family protein